MKKLATVLAVGLALSSAAAMASDGKVTINGELKTLTCTINGGVGDIVVTLPTLSTATVTGSATGGSTAFTMDLTACSGSTAKAFFEQGPNNTINGNLKNTVAGGAANVEIQLKNANDVVLDLNQPAATQDNVTADISTGSGKLTYFAQYKAVGTTTAGLVSSSTTYSLVYN
ncbi:fimbrial protein [Vogesella amnigena]|uniref:Fimbrial protein n=1 Tax=Vogesella amnigena TaxID=1507449 RepID=A0ABV7TRX9_9NEIS